LRILLDWLKDYIELPDNVDMLAEKLTEAGLEATVEKIGAEIPNEIVIGEIQSVEKHPNADRLSICMVDCGDSEPRQIICGAPNVAAGQKVPVALPGTVLGKDFKIKKAKVRGMHSDGMICAEDELGISDDHSGIMVLPAELKAGQPFHSYYKAQTVLELDLTPNRPDCFSHFGVAREIAAITGAKIQFPQIVLPAGEKPVTDFASVAIADPDGCPRYTARVITNVKVAPSPQWLKQRLEAVGVRSVNNIVDASNYVLMETGHPLHVFDYDKLAGHHIEVRFAKENESFTTLDHKKRILSSNVLLICDAEKPVAMAGIMGGLDSEVTDDTVNVLIESAYFNPASIRKGSKEQQLSSEASKRFERGMDPNHKLIYSQNRLAELILQLAGGQLAEGVIDCYPQVIEPQKILFSLSHFEKIAGFPLSKDRFNSILLPLGFEISAKDKDGEFEITTPTFRPDIQRPIDIVEELLRLEGYEAIPDPDSIQLPMIDNINPLYPTLEKIRNFWLGKGFQEAVCNSLISFAMADAGVWGRKALKLQNPLSADMDTLRTDLLQPLAAVVKTNLMHKREGLRFFEIGTVVAANHQSETGADESTHLAAILCAPVWEPFWNEQSKSAGLFYLKGLAESFLINFHINDFHYEAREISGFSQVWALIWQDKTIGLLGEFQKENISKIPFEYPVIGFEIDLLAILGKKPYVSQYQAIPQFPGIVRDVSVVTDKQVKAGELLDTIHKNGGKYLQEVKTYDLFEDHNKLGQNKKAVSFRLRFLNAERTLTDEDIDPTMEKIFHKLSKEHGAQLR
jgi:phenylalanyl-tRNA synthetase beta chain